MDNTIDSLKNELKRAQLELNQIKKDTISKIATEQASAKVATARAVATAYADGMKEAFKKLEQHIQKQHTVLASAVSAAEESAKKIARAAMAKEAAARAKRAAAVEKAAAAQRAAIARKAAAAEKAAAKKAAAMTKKMTAAASKRPNAPQVKQPNMPAAGGSLHEKRLGILEREFNPTKSARSSAVETTSQGSGNPNGNKNDWS